MVFLDRRADAGVKTQARRILSGSARATVARPSKAAASKAMKL
jgi:hypothetical protein